MAMQFEYDPERLIEEVKKRPGIWDFENQEYKTKNMRHKLWTEVVSELMQGDVKVSKSEMRELEIQLQKKWKSMRDCFQKFLNHPQRTKRPYIYSKHLQFLLKDQSFPQVEAASSDSDGSQSKRKRVWRPKKKLKLTDRREQEVSSEEEVDVTFENHDDSRSNDGTTIEIPGKSSFYSNKTLDEFVFANVDSQTKNEIEDHDKLFLLSLLPHLRRIPDEFKLNVKMDLMQVLRNASFHASKIG